MVYRKRGKDAPGAMPARALLSARSGVWTFHVIAGGLDRVIVDAFSAKPDLKTITCLKLGRSESHY